MMFFILAKKREYYHNFNIRAAAASKTPKIYFMTPKAVRVKKHLLYYLKFKIANIAARRKAAQVCEGMLKSPAGPQQLTKPKPPEIQVPGAGIN